MKFRVLWACLLLIGGAAAQTQTQTPPPPPDKERWNKTFVNPKPVFNTEPNKFLAEAIKGRTPGKALDIGMGQGRNSIYLAQQGWDVTGLDISDEGARIARERAAKLGLKLDVALQSAYEYDYGREKWDLIAGIFMQTVIPRVADKIQQALKPGAIFVAEGFHEDSTRGQEAAQRFGYKTNDLLRRFDGLRIIHYEDRLGPADWAGGQERPIVRFIARKE